MQKQKSNCVAFREIPIALGIAILTCLGLFCSLEKPTAVDGTFALKVVVVDTTSMKSSPVLVADAKVQIKCDTYKISTEQFTDSNGETEFFNLLAGRYRISVSKEIIIASRDNNDALMLIGNSEINIGPSISEATDSIMVHYKMPDNLVINEIYYTGVSDDNRFYLDDQFVELYNPTADTIDLNGYVIARGGLNKDYIGTEFVECVYAYQFAGTKNEYLARPHDFIVIAQDAIDHRQIMPNSIDLSKANFEFFSGNDFDNPAVPNLLPLFQSGASNDFMLNTLHDVVLLIKPTAAIQLNPRGNLLFQLADVIDGVKYTIQPDDKFIQPTIDRGHAGTEMQRYSGKSIERHHPIMGHAGYDSNNSSFDFIIIYPPTPKRQHSSAQAAPPGS